MNNINVMRVSNSRYISLAKIVFGVILLFAVGQISIPLKPVPITLSTVGFMLIGLTYKPKSTFYTVTSWLLLGAAGAPMFAGFKFGIATLLGPTGGYIIGMCVSACVMSLIMQRKPNNKSNIFFIIMVSVLGTIITYSFGILYLASFVGVNQAIALGLVPFIFSGIVKTIILSLLVRYGIKITTA